MKTLVLLFTLLLHATGLWGRLPDHARASLTAAAATVPVPASDVAIAGATPAGPIPVLLTTDPPHIAAASALAIDTATGTILFDQNSTAHRPIASISKIITCLVVLSRHSVDEKVTVPTLPNYDTADELMGLVPGETFRLGDLITAALVQSANDAADTLAIYDAGTSAKFAARMNAKMTEWGITGTRFSSPTGLQDTGNYATAQALAKIAQLDLANPVFRSAVKRTYANISSTAGRTFNLTNTDQLLATGQFYGIKTGYTPAAGECFVGLTRIQGHEVITVVLGADDRFSATQDLTNWIGHSWQWL